MLFVSFHTEEPDVSASQSVKYTDTDVSEVADVGAAVSFFWYASLASTGRAKEIVAERQSSIKTIILCRKDLFINPPHFLGAVR
jgi:hypothetical protein